jgi:hypothetical protein
VRSQKINFLTKQNFMAFSFNPAQTPQAGGVPTASPFASAPMPGAAPSGIPSIPDSPFLIMQNRDQPATVNAYLQLVLLLIAVLTFIVSLILFGYGMYLSSSVASKKETITQKESSFKEYPLDEMRKFSTRSAGLNGFLKGYLSARSAFKLLEDAVEKKVYFSQFSLIKDAKSGMYSITLTAITDSYPVLVQQLSALNLSQYAKIVPKTRIDKVTQKDDSSKLKVKVSAPILAQGMLSEDLVFLPSGETSKTAATTTTP